MTPSSLTHNSPEAKLQLLLFNNVNALIAYIDLQEVYRCANDTYARWFGLNPRSLIGKTIREVLGEHSYEAVHPHFSQACSGHTAVYETSIFDGDQRKFCQGNYTPHFGESGEVIGVFVVVTDITHRHDAEFVLRQSEQRFQTAFDYAIIGMALLSPQGGWVQVNPAICNMLGYTEAELLMLTVWDITHPDQHPAARASMEQLVSEAAPAVQVERCYVRKDGVALDVLLSGSLVRGKDGAPINFVLQIQDISSRKADERLKQEFISTVSHELRTPLTSILGSLGLIAGGAAGTLPDRAARLLSIAQSNCARLVRLINDILDIEKMESGAATLKKQPVNLRAIAKRAIASLGGYAQPYSVDIILTPGKSPEVLGDEDRLIQVIINFVSNAVKYSPIHGRVEVCILTSGENVRVSVRDYGPGVPMEFRGRIFSKFAQADGSDTRRRGGTGLGLAIAREIIEQHHGRIWFESVPEQGATFSFELSRYTRRADLRNN